MKFLLLLVLCSCGGEIIYPEHIKKANEICSHNDGWDYIELDQSATIHCKNRMSFKYYYSEMMDERRMGNK